MAASSTPKQPPLPSQDEGDGVVRESHGVNKGKALIGPFSDYRTAFLATVPDDATGIRVILSVPNGDIIGTLPRRGHSIFRRVAQQTGQGGSIDETGEWLTAEEVKFLTWRPA